MAPLARFHCPEVSAPGEKLVLEGEELHHLRNVLRLRRGDHLALFDGRGRGFQASLLSIDAKQAVLLVGAEESTPPESALELHLAMALAKGDKLDLVIQKGTELGVFAFHPLVSARADLKLDPARAETRAARWQRVALEACKQSGRARIPEILPPADLDRFLETDLPEERIVLDPSGDLLSSLPPRPEPGPVVVAIGPEGGWEPDELIRLCAHQFAVLRLGPRILRAETAAFVAACVWQLRNGDLAR